MLLRYEKRWRCAASGGSEKTACANGCENVVCRTQRHVQLFLYIGSAPISHKTRSVTVHLRLNRFPAAPPRSRTQKSQGKANGYCWQNASKTPAKLSLTSNGAIQSTSEVTTQRSNALDTALDFLLRFAAYSRTTLRSKLIVVPRRTSHL